VPVHVIIDVKDEKDRKWVGWMYISTDHNNRQIELTKQLTDELRAAVIDNRDNWEHQLSGTSGDETVLEHINLESGILAKLDACQENIRFTLEEIQELLDILDISIEMVGCSETIDQYIAIDGALRLLIG
jgi:hypothetical protein